jgi:hypothetical protein
MESLAKEDDAISFAPGRGDASASCAMSIRGLRAPACPGAMRVRSNPAAWVNKGSHGLVSALESVAAQLT